MFGSMKQKTGCGKKRKKKKERKKGNLKQHIIMCIQEMPTPSEFHHVCSKGFFFPFFKLTSFRHRHCLTTLIQSSPYSPMPLVSLLLLLLFSCYHYCNVCWTLNLFIQAWKKSINVSLFELGLIVSFYKAFSMFRFQGKINWFGICVHSV